MRITPINNYTNRQGRSFSRMSFEQRAELRKRYIADIPRWRYPLVGYFMSILAILAASLAILLTQHLLGRLSFPSNFLILAVLFIAIFWGVGPAIFCVLFGVAVLNYYFISPLGQSSLVSWQEAVQLLPLIIAGFTVAIITAQRERARLNAHAAEQELKVYSSELETINQKLEDADQTKDRFLSIASHELKTPITTIRGQAQLLLRRLSKQKEISPEMENVRVTLEKINDQTGRLTLLVEELLEVSGIRAGKLELHKQECDLKDICRSVVEDQHLLTGRPIELEMPSTAVRVEVDRDRLAQVIVNLVSNAVKYSPEGGPVEVCTRQCDHKAIIEVHDHGKGIAKDQQTRIFETFYRTPDAEASAKKGLGLGLAISKDIVERHHGRIWCESEPGQGSTFFVELPI